MAMTKKQFDDAFREVVSREYYNIPNNEYDINISFSENFEKKMRKLIKSQKTIYWRFINSSAKKVAVIFLVCTVFLTSAMSVRAIREPVVEFFKEVYDTFVSYFFEGDTIDELPYENSHESLNASSTEISDEVSSESNLSLQIPEGFTQIDVLEDENMISEVYSNDNGDIIEFVKMITSDTRLTFDTEHMESKTIFISNTKVDIYQGDGIMHAVWIEKSTLMLITCSGDIELSDLENMVSYSINN